MYRDILYGYLKQKKGKKRSSNIPLLRESESRGKRVGISIVK